MEKTLKRTTTNWLNQVESGKLPSRLMDSMAFNLPYPRRYNATLDQNAILNRTPIFCLKKNIFKVKMGKI